MPGCQHYTEAENKLEALKAELKQYITERLELDRFCLVVFVDISGSTELSHGKPEDYADTIVKFFYRVSRQIAAGNGPLAIKTIGDAVMLAEHGDDSPCPARVVEMCAWTLSLVKGLHEIGVDVKACIGIAHKKLLKGTDIDQLLRGFLANASSTPNCRKRKVSIPVDKKDVWGFGVNQTARLESVAKKGQVLVDPVVVTCLQKHIADNPAVTLPFKLAVPQRPSDGIAGFPFRLKGLGRSDLHINQICSIDGLPESEFHLVSGYGFGALVALRITKKFLQDNGNGAATTKLATAIRQAFPFPLAVAIYKIQEVKVDNPSDHLCQQDLDSNFGCILASKDFEDFTRRMGMLSADSVFTKYVDRTSTNPLLQQSTDEHSEVQYLFDPMPMFDLDTGAGAYLGTLKNKLPIAVQLCLYRVKSLTRTNELLVALSKHKKNGTQHVVDYWCSVGHYDLVVLLDASNHPQVDQERHKCATLNARDAIGWTDGVEGISWWVADIEHTTA